MANVGSMSVSLKLDTSNYVNGLKSIKSGNAEIQSAFSKTGIEGKKAFEETKNKVDSLSKGLKNSKTNSDKLGNSFKSTGESASALIQSLGQLAIGGTILAGFKSILDVGIKFNVEMSKVKAVTGATTEEMKLLREEAQKLGSTTTFTSAEAASAMNELAKAGLSTNQILSATTDVLSLAQAGELSLAQAAMVTSDVMSQFNLSAEESKRIADSLANGANNATIGVNELSESMKYVGGIANSMNISLEQTTAMISILGNAGIKGSQAGTGLNNVLRNLTTISPKSARALKTLNVELLDANKELLPLPDIMQQFQDKLSNVSNAQKLELLNTIFGAEGAPAALALINAGSESIEKMTGKIAKQGEAARIAAEKNNNLAGDLKALDSASEGVSGKIADALDPIMRALTQSATTLLQWVNDFIKLYPNFSKGAIIIASSIAGITAVLIGTSGAIFAIKSLRLGILAANAANVLFGNTLTALAATSAAKWALILGPLALLAAGVTALVYTVTVKIREERERVERSQRLGDVAQTTGSETVFQSASERRGELENIEKIRTAIYKLEQAKASTVNTTERVSRAQRDLNLKLTTLHSSATRTALEFANVSEQFDSARSILKGYEEGVKKAKLATDQNEESTNRMTFSLGGAKSMLRSMSEDDFVNFTRKAREANDIVNASFRTLAEGQELSKVRENLKKVANDYNAQIKSVLVQDKDTQFIEYQVSLGKDSKVKTKEQVESFLKSLKATSSKSLEIKAVSDSETEKLKKIKNSYFPGINNELTKMVNSFTSLDKQKKDFLKNNDFSEFGKVFVNATYGIEKAKVALQSLGNAFVNMLQSQAKLAQTNLKNFTQNLNFLTSAYDKHLEKMAMADNLANQTELDKLNDQLKALQDARDDAERIRLARLKEANLAIEAENNKAYQNEIQRLQAEYQAKIDNIYSTSGNQEQALIQEQLLWEEFNQRKSGLLDYYNNKTITDQEKAQKESEEKQRIANESSISQEQNLAQQIEAIQLRMSESDKAYQAQKDESRRKSALLEWSAGKSAFEVNKRAQVMQAQLQFAMLVMSAMQAAAALTASTMGFGFPMAMAMAGTLIAGGTAALMTVQAAQGAQYPPPPIFEQGGMVGGNLHANGGSLIEAERGEFVVNRQATARNLDLLTSINNGDNINNKSSSIVLNNTFNIAEAHDPEMITQYVSERIVEKIAVAQSGTY